jgi:hypothetical protein
VRQTAFDGAASRYHRLSDHLSAEDPLPARLRAVAAKQIHLDRLEIEDGNQVNQSFGHMSAFGLVDSSSIKPAVIPGREQKRASPESITTIGSMDSGPAPSKSAVADLDNDIAEPG